MDKDYKKIETTEEVTEKELDDGKQIFTFTQEGIVVRAENLQEATKIYEKTLKQNKESDND